MRAVGITAPNEATVLDRPDPQAGPGEVLIHIERAGLCGTDVALFRGTMPYLADGRTTLPLQPGHEWAGRVVSVGEGVTSAAAGGLVTGDTFIGCGVCTLCTSGRHHLCPDHLELGVLGQLDGALAELLVVPERAVHRLPAGVDADLGAMVEPASCSLRGVRLTAVGPGDRVLVWGAGTLGMFAALFAADAGAAVAVAARRDSDRNFVAGFGLETRDPADLGAERFDVIIEATGSAEVTQRLLDNATAGARIALLGVPGGDVGLPSGRLIALDATVHAVLGGSADIDEAARRFATMGDTGRRLIGSVITLDEVPRVLAERLPRAAGGGPKTQIRF
ncbi:zinc-dependent alcohol dehydrogenase [Plantibacter cousiniae (nom. nud.)]|uniref:zinc-dependent alcohol dehydrogenase n=1 Tax=Plantibacter cousiniae (nom. nud.) TaxID=199709 RepID=UPI001D2066D1|nr:alcohol dehydrogenase catalytic domain-containing protein [Plantibacter cousiniae]CAH0179458.1 L-threonine 3-dehydrogenase [Plantibacter cousiniae]